MYDLSGLSSRIRSGFLRLWMRESLISKIHFKMSVYFWQAMLDIYITLHCLWHRMCQSNHMRIWYCNGDTKGKLTSQWKWVHFKNHLICGSVGQFLYLMEKIVRIKFANAKLTIRYYMHLTFVSVNTTFQWVKFHLLL